MKRTSTSPHLVTLIRHNIAVGDGSVPFFLFLGNEQELPYASGEGGGAGARVKSSSAFPARPEQQKDYMSDLAVAESVAALGECLVPCSWIVEVGV